MTVITEIRWRNGHKIECPQCHERVLLHPKRSQELEANEMTKFECDCLFSELVYPDDVDEDWTHIDPHTHPRQTTMTTYQ